MNLAQYIRPLTASLSFYLIPLLCGIGVNALIKRKKKLNGIFLLESFVIGTISLFIQTIILNQLKVFSLFETERIFAFLTGINVAVNLVTYFFLPIKAIDQASSTKKEWIQNISICIFMAFITITVYWVWRLGSPMHTTLNWDIYHHQTLINIINQGKFGLVTSSLSDSFQFAGYSTIFHTIASISQTLFKPNILEFWFFVEYLHLLLGAVIAFFFTYAFTKNKFTSVISSLLATLIFESSMAYTNLFLIPQNLAGLISAGFLAKISLEYPQNKRLLATDFLIFSLFLIPLHLIIGTFGVFLALITIIFLYTKPIKESNKVQNLLLLGSLICIPLVFFISKSIDFSHINRGEAAYYIFSIGKKIATMKDIYGYGLIAFLPLGYFYALKTKESKYKLLLILINGMFAILIGILPYNLKFLAVGRFPLFTLMSLGMWILIKDLPNIIKCIFLALSTATFGIVFVINIYMYKGVPNYKNLSTHVSPPEIEVAKFLQETYAKEANKVLLVSDPATMHILEGLSGINSPGGAYTSIENRQILTSIYLRRDETLRKRLFEIRDLAEENDHNKVLLVLSGRFREWQLGPEEDRYGIHWNVWRPKDLDPEELQEHDFIYYLEKVLGFKRVFTNEGVVVFEVERGFL